MQKFIVEDDLNSVEGAIVVNNEWLATDQEETLLKNKTKLNYISIPWSPQEYFTVRGAENFHIYLWIAKDLAWSQSWYWPAMIFGCSALAWCGVLAYHAIVSRSFNETYMLIALILWLAGNFVWMSGEVFNNDDDYVLSKAAHIMEAAIAWMLLYYVVLKPLKLIPPDEAMNKRYEEADLKSRFSYFEHWRIYEHAHTLCWLGKDLSWNTENPYTWVLCLIPTILIAADFIWITWKSKKMFIDCMHYVAQLIWVIGNGAWAMGEIFHVPGYGDDTVPYSMMHFTEVAISRCRWWSSWILLGAYAPIVFLYLIWLPLTCLGKIKAVEK